MRPFRLIAQFIRASALQDLAYRENFLISLFHSVLNLAIGFAGLGILYNRTSAIQGWDFPSALALLGVYLIVSAVRGLFIGPSLEMLVGLGQEVWSGQFDFALVRPVNVQFLITFRQWRLTALTDLALGLAVLIAALRAAVTPPNLAALAWFAGLLCAGLITLYAVLLIFTALSFYNPGLILTWVFDAVFQLGRYPVQVYPGWLRGMLTWVIPVGMITTLPAQALTGRLHPIMGAAGLAAAGGLFWLASAFFRRAVRTYSSASS